MKKSANHYFLAHDSLTSRLEFIAFSGLGLAGAVLITTALTNSLQFAQNREAIVQELSAPGSATVELANRNPAQALTNLLSAHAATPRTRPKISPATPGSGGSDVFLPQCQIMMDRTTRRWKIKGLQ